MRTLICGSLAFDTIMVFPDRFARHILPDQAHVLSVSFQIGEMRREWGGCAGNIAYNLQALGGDAVPMATLGEDGGPYRERLTQLGIPTDGVRTVPGTYTAQAFIITDLDDNQITAFHPGAMNHSHKNHVTRELSARLAIIALDGKEGMLQHARECAAAAVPFLFDPGQGLPMFSGEEIGEFLRLADYVAVNDYEGKMLEEKRGRKLEALARDVKALVCTLGAKGSLIFAAGKRYEVPCVRAEAVVDPTGCGDAYRAGLLYGIARGWDWDSTGRLGAVMGAVKIAHRGGQNHTATRDEIERRFRGAFGYSPWRE